VDPGDEDDWLYDSGRTYMEQLSAYQEHKNVANINDVGEAASETKVCLMCQAEFSNPHPQAIYCSPACRQAYFLAKNANPDHVTNEQKRELIIAALKADPNRSNNQISEEIGREAKTIGRVRKELEDRGEIPHFVPKKGPRRD
jgi:hypothetical protein